MNSRLVVKPPGEEDSVLPLLRHPVSLGRSPRNELSFPSDWGLSRRHAVIEQHGNGWRVRDLGSLNGTYVNRRKVDGMHPLRSGDHITASRIVIVYEELSEVRENAGVVFDPDEPNPDFSTVQVTDLKRILETPAPGAALSGRRGLREWASPTQALLRAGRTLAAHRPLNEIFQTILELAAEATGAQRGVLMTLEEGELVPQARRGSDFRISAAVCRKVLQERLSLIVRDTQSNQEWKSRDSLAAQGVRSLLAVPLQTDEQVVGLLYLDTPGSARAFHGEHLEFLTVMANIAAMRIDRERLIEIERASRLFEAELQQAASIQQQCLPKQAPLLPGFDIAGYSTPCRTVGGDYFDYLPQTDGALGIAIADVAGKGMPASLLMMNLQARMQALANDLSDPGEVVRRLNESLIGICPTNRFITLFLGVLRPESGVLRYTNAGHEPPLAIRAAGGSEELSAGGPIVGLFPGARFETGEIRLDPQDALVMFSDGVTEAHNAGGEEFGKERAGEIFRSRGEARAEEMIERVNQAVSRWLGALPTTDDVTVVALIRL